MWDSFIHIPIKMLLVIKNILTGTMDEKVDDNGGRAKKKEREGWRRETEKEGESRKDQSSQCEFIYRSH